MFRILVVDGNYLANNVLGVENMGDKVNHLQTKEDLKSFRTALNVSIKNLYEKFDPYVDTLIFCVDGKSWRKSVPGVIPYYMPEDEKANGINYKDNRSLLKEKSETNYNNFNLVYDEFIEDLKTIIPVIRIDGLEGDDLMMLLSNKVNGSKNLELLVYANDGDIEQVVRDNVMLMRNIRSKEAPDGEFVITYKKYQEVFEAEENKMTAFLGSSIDNKKYEDLFSLHLFNPKARVKRTLNNGIRIATPFEVAVTKSISGDKKDNLFPILRWVKGSKNYKVTDNHLKQALKKENLILTESVCKKMIADKEFAILIIGHLIEITSQSGLISAEDAHKHFMHNIMMNTLSRSVVPAEHVIKFDEYFNEFFNKIINRPLPLDVFNVLNTKRIANDGAKVLMESLPDELNEILQ